MQDAGKRNSRRGTGELMLREEGRGGDEQKRAHRSEPGGARQVCRISKTHKVMAVDEKDGEDQETLLDSSRHSLLCHAAFKLAWKRLRKSTIVPEPIDRHGAGVARAPLFEQFPDHPNP